jgi:hypothetical protein
MLYVRVCCFLYSKYFLKKETISMLFVLQGRRRDGMEQTYYWCSTRYGRYYYLLDALQYSRVQYSTLCMCSYRASSTHCMVLLSATRRRCAAVVRSFRRFKSNCTYVECLYRKYGLLQVYLLVLQDVPHIQLTSTVR